MHSNMQYQIFKFSFTLKQMALTVAIWDRYIFLIGSRGWISLPGLLSVRLLCLFDSLRQQGQWRCPVIVLTAPIPVGWRRVMRVFHYRRDGWVRLADADRQQMCKSWWWFVKGSTASQSRWRAMQGGGKLCWGTLSVMVHLLSQQGKGQFKRCCCQLTFFWCVHVGFFVLIYSSLLNPFLTDYFGVVF